MTNMKISYWNIWWTLAVLSAAIGALAVILEYLGITCDLWFVIGVVSMALTVLFGLTASTRSAVNGLRSEVVPVLERIEQILNERLPRGQSLKLQQHRFHG